jgi:hypothetical protein
VPSSNLLATARTSSGCLLPAYPQALCELPVAGLAVPLPTKNRSRFFAAAIHWGARPRPVQAVPVLPRHLPRKQMR